MCHWQDLVAPLPPHAHKHKLFNGARVSERSEGQNSSLVVGGKIKWFFHFYRAEPFLPWTIKGKQHTRLGGTLEEISPQMQ